MSIFQRIQAERDRQQATGDDWYLTNQPYVLEFRSHRGTAKFVFPLSPKEYSVKRHYRTNVEATVGGVSTEELGLLWIEIHIRGSFALEPRFGYDDGYTDDYAPVDRKTKLSGPMWTRRLIKVYFEQYAKDKADPNHAHEAMLIWHDLKTDDHWVVVPEEVGVDRSVSERLRYPFEIQLKAIGEASGIEDPTPDADLTTFMRAENALAEARKAVAKIDAAITESSRFLGEIRFYANTVDSVIDDLTTVSQSIGELVEGVVQTASIGRVFIQSTISGLDALLDALEDAEAIPDDVVQLYVLALRGCEDLAARRSLFSPAYNEAADSVRNAELGASRADQTARTAAAESGSAESAGDYARRSVQATDQALIDAEATGEPRSFRAYEGMISHTVTETDTLESLAARYLGDSSRWYEIVLVNGLRSPYMSRSGIPGTVGVGDLLSIPTPAPQSTRAIAEDPEAELWGKDFALVETGKSRPGAPAVDYAIDRRTYRDFRFVSGEANLRQALQMRVWTEQGSMPHAPAYGLSRAVGEGITDDFLTLLRVELRRTIASDSRVSRISRFAYEGYDDVIEFDMDIVPIGYDTVRTFALAIV